ncbi:MAG TPA: aldo/keto reductase, partial [Candidatus Bathyarchaeia archaeon]|nr:aldo/keto reductase [Candidatus Bathyarchaeia archaeon]
FQAQGKIKYIGVSNFDVELMKRALATAAVLSLQSPLSLLNRVLQTDVLPFCQQKGIGVLAYGPLAGGILSGKYKTPTTFAKSDARSFFYQYYQGERYKAVTRFLNDLASLGRPLDQLAINWVRQQPAVASVLVGCRNPQQVERNAAATDWDLTDDQLKFINERLPLLS